MSRSIIAKAMTVLDHWLHALTSLRAYLWDLWAWQLMGN